MAEPAGELETLWPRDDPPRGAGARRRGASLTRRARFGLFLGLVVFTTGALVQLIATAWFGLVMGLFYGSAEVLVHTRGLDRQTFAVCSVTAVILDAILLIAIAISRVRRSVRRPPPNPERFAARHPFIAASTGLLLALAFVIACGWSPSPYFPYPLATIIVLTCAYWFGLVGVFAMARLADVAWRVVKSWGVASEWRAGFLTACLLLAGGTGYWLLTTQWYAAPLHTVEARLEIDEPGRATGALSGELDELCVAASQIEPALVHSASAPACRFLAGGNQQTDDCFTTLMANAVPNAKQRLGRSGLRPHDIDDAVMKALLATCTREPPPGDLAAYFFIAARNETWKQAQDARRTVACDQLPEPPADCTWSDPPEVREVKLAQLWDDALCRLDPTAAEVVRRRLQQDESFREISEHLRLTETRAKDTFHNAIKKLRRQMLTACEKDNWL